MKDQTENISIKKFIAFQDECEHKGNFLPLAQQTFPDTVTRKLVLFNTVICGNCGKQFVQNVLTEISIGTIQSPGFLRQ